MFNMDRGTQSESGEGGSFRRQAWAEWTDASIIAAWLKWGDKAAVHHRALTDLLIRSVSPLPGLRVLDVASGLGEPALTIAREVGSGGQVSAVEISAEFVQAIAASACQSGIANLAAIQAEACQLPFPNHSFDIATSRLGAMYFVPISQALSEIRRVLVPGGKVALLTWGMPEQGTFFASCVFPFLARSHIQPPPADAPTPFRFSPPGRLASELKAAGFREIQEERHLAAMTWPGPPEELWTYLYETAAAFRTVFDSLAPAEFEEAKSEALALLQKTYESGQTTTTAEVVVGTGLAP